MSIFKCVIAAAFMSTSLIGKAAVIPQPTSSELNFWGVRLNHKITEYPQCSPWAKHELCWMKAASFPGARLDSFFFTQMKPGQASANIIGAQTDNGVIVSVGMHSAPPENRINEIESLLIGWGNDLWKNWAGPARNPKKRTTTWRAQGVSGEVIVAEGGVYLVLWSDLGKAAMIEDLKRMTR